MTRRGKWKKLIDEVLADYELDLDISQKDIDRERNNRIRSLDARTSSIDEQALHVNTPREYAKLIIVAVMMTRVQRKTKAKWEMDHMKAWSNGGTNHIGNLAPSPSKLNKMKENDEWSTEKTNRIVKLMPLELKTELSIPSNYVYETTWEWVIRNFG